MMLGLFYAICFLAGGLGVLWRTSINPIWVLLVIGVFGGMAISVTIKRHRRLFLQRFWSRSCNGIRWKRCFPDSPSTQIRSFLDVFVDAFGFPQERRLSFSPDDKVMEIYRGLYPEMFMADDMELETLASNLRRKYGVDAESFWKEDITFGELFAHML